MANQSFIYNTTTGGFVDNPFTVNKPIIIRAAGITETIPIYMMVGDCPSCRPEDVLWEPVFICDCPLELTPTNNIVKILTPGKYSLGDPNDALFTIAGDVNITKEGGANSDPLSACNCNGSGSDVPPCAGELVEGCIDDGTGNPQIAFTGVDKCTGLIIWGPLTKEQLGFPPIIPAPVPLAMVTVSGSGQTLIGTGGGTWWFGGVDTGNATHVSTGAGDYTFYGTNLAPYNLTAVTGGLATDLVVYPAGDGLVELTSYLNANFAYTSAVAGLPSTMEHLSSLLTMAAITGPITDFPATMTFVSLTYTNSNITGVLTDITPIMTRFDVNNTASVISGLVTDFYPALTYFGAGNTTSMVNGTLSDIGPNMTTLNLANTNSIVSGTLLSIVPNMTYLNLSGTLSAVTGDLAAAPSTITYLGLGSTLSNITCTAIPLGVNRLYLQNVVPLVADIDSILAQLDANGLTNGVVNLNGSNPAPTGGAANANLLSLVGKGWTVTTS